MKCFGRILQGGTWNGSSRVL